MKSNCLPTEIWKYLKWNECVTGENYSILKWERAADVTPPSPIPKKYSSPIWQLPTRTKIFWTPSRIEKFQIPIAPKSLCDISYILVSETNLFGSVTRLGQKILYYRFITSKHKNLSSQKPVFTISCTMQVKFSFYFNVHHLFFFSFSLFLLSYNARRIIKLSVTCFILFFFFLCIIMFFILNFPFRNAIKWNRFLTRPIILVFDLLGMFMVSLDTRPKLNVHRTFRRRPGHLLNVLCTFNLRVVQKVVFKTKLY